MTAKPRATGEPIMKLHHPFMISSRLMAGVQVGQATISIGYDRQTSEGRIVYDVWIDLPDRTEYHINDLRSGCQGGSLQEGMSSLLSFLSASAESYGYRQRTGRQTENEDLFNPVVVQWAYEHEDELSMLALELEETENLIEE